MLQYALQSDQQALLGVAVGKCVEAGVRATVASAGEESGATDTLSDKVLHMTTGDYITVKLLWASEYIFEEFCKRQEAALHVELESFLTAASTSSTVASLRGLLFEPYVHRLFSKGGNFEYRDLDDENSPDKPHSIRLNFTDTSVFRQLVDINSVQPNVYYRPSVGNLAAADSCAVVDKTLYIFQVTVSASHDVSNTGLSRLIQTVRDVCSGPLDSTVLAFVVPRDQFQHYQRQSFANEDRTAAQRQRNDCDQWAIQIPV